ncbi:S8 family serine peptidase [Kitasatospora sp. NPDC090308]|uniref:S8 family serine peptidase n=1 Tax=Kitasatospora sp. NPDC090308 TaxID=3364082 RepID=UPI00380A7629
MGLARLTGALGATALTAGMLFAGAPAASADQVRDAQWANAYFDLDKVWSVSKGDGVIVAVIDTGVKANHPDLSGSLLPGYDPGGQGREIKPTTEHGTGMASLIAGHGHGNGEGVTGLAPGAKILPIFHGDGGAMPQGIKWAVDHGAKVINISQVTDLVEQDSFTDAVAYALQHKVLIVAGTGNDGGPVRPPANVPGVLAVGAVDKNQRIWPQSNYGPEVMLTAPGVDIVMAGSGGSGSCTSQYCMADGTSDSTAYVSAAAALVFAKYPDLTPGQVANRLVKTAAAPAGASKLPDSHYGYGVVRPYQALTANVPAGSAQGPLAAAAGAAAPSAGAGATQETKDPGSDGVGTGGLGSPGAVPGVKQSSSGSALPLVLAIGGGLVVLLIVVIAIAVSSSRKRNRNRAQGFQAQAGVSYGAAPGWPPAQQQPYGQPGQQPPPYGYPPQQPPYNNPYQDGNQSR